MQSAIVAIGTANPKYKRAQLETAELIADALQLKPAEKRLLKTVYRATGIKQRYSVLRDYCSSPGQLDFFPNHPDLPFPSTAVRMNVYKENALDLALLAIENCLSTLSKFDSRKITHVITVSCTGMYAPGLDIEIVQNLNLPSTTKRTAINFMGCYGAFNALKVAEAIVKAESEAIVLVVCVEICTIHFQKSMDLESIIPNSIFADGAAAALVQAKPQQPQKYFALEAFYCDLLPQSNQEMTWQIADSGFDITLSTYVPEVIKSGISDFFQRLLTKNLLAFSQVNYYAIHPGGLKILQACEEALNISKEHNKYSYQVLSDYGNMSSVTILFVLKALWNDIQHSDHHKNIFSCAFGPGLTLESMILKTHSTK